MVWQLPGNECADVRGLPTGLIDLSTHAFKPFSFLFSAIRDPHARYMTFNLPPFLVLAVLKTP